MPPSLGALRWPPSLRGWEGAPDRADARGSPRRCRSGGPWAAVSGKAGLPTLLAEGSGPPSRAFDVPALNMEHGLECWKTFHIQLAT